MLHSSQSPSHQHWESRAPIPLHWDTANACATGKRCASGSCAPQLATGTSSVWALQVQKHFTLQGVCGGGCSWKGSAGSCSLPAVICQIISLQPAQMLLALGCVWSTGRAHRGHTGLPGGPSLAPFPSTAAAQASMGLQLTHPAENSNFAG